jgi:thiol-disulfide isomerase/thioredoxin
MPTRRTLFGLAVAAATSFAVAGSPATLAGEKLPYDAGAFAAALQDGQSVVVEISAPWCPTCRAQKPIISQLIAEPRFADLTVFEVDFDSQKDVVRGLGARSQSTLIAYKGETEVGRSVGDTRPASIEALFDATL